MTRQYQREVEKLKQKILHLSAMVEHNLHAAVRSIDRRDAELARGVIESDSDIDQFEVEVEEEVLKMLALYQPVASDLRFIISVLKINIDLERIADLAVNIAQRTREIVRLLGHDVPLEAPFDVDGMLSLSLDMVKRSTDAFIRQDVVVARAVCADDDEMDARHREAFTLIEGKMRENPDAVEYLVSFLSVSRNLERIGDHATNIAEDVIYLVEGEIVRHQDG